jgi:prefoldin subunit 5
VVFAAKAQADVNIANLTAQTEEARARIAAYSGQIEGFKAVVEENRSAIAALASARRAPIYLLVDGKPKQTMVRVGASDGSNTQVSGDIREGDKVIVGAEHAAPAP